MNPAVIQPAKEDLYYFVRYLLWEACFRVRPAKRRRPPQFDSFWLARGGWTITTTAASGSRPPQLAKQTRKTFASLPIRDSDLRERSYACIEALVKIGRYNTSKAAVEVAGVLGYTRSVRVRLGEGRSMKGLGGIRTDYYYLQRVFRDCTLPVSMWFMDFFSWRDWVLSSDDFTIWFALQKYQERFSLNRARRLAALMIEMRQDPIQAARNAVWRASQQPGSCIFVPEP